MNIETIANFAAAVRARRVELGLSQAELGERAGLSRKYMSAVERGSVNPSLVTILRLARPLGYTMRLDDRVEQTPRVDLDALIERHARP